MGFDDSPALAESLCCPTCRARQPWTAECRRCKSDLRLLVQVHELAGRLRLAALNALREGRLDDAAQAAQTWQRLDRSSAATRLLAVCRAREGNFPALERELKNAE